MTAVMADKHGRGSTILVPIDLYGIAPVVLKNLVSIAHSLDCGLLGLVLQDGRLQRAATLPFTTEIVRDSGRERGLLPASVEQHHSRIARDIRSSLHALASKEQVKLEFDQAVGSRLRGVLSRGHEWNVFIPPRSRWQVATLVTRVAIPRAGVLLTGGDYDVKVLQVAQTLMEAGQVGDIYQLTWGGLSEENSGELLPGRGSVIACTSIGASDSAIVSLLRHCPYDLLILPRDCLNGLSPLLVEQVLDQSPGQVLLVG
jgi:hypothetical protein